MRTRQFPSCRVGCESEKSTVSHKPRAAEALRKRYPRSGSEPPLVMLSSTRLYPITLGLYTWNTQYGQTPNLYAYVVTGAMISVIPLIVAFLSLQRFWRSGLTAGSVKL